MPSPDGFSGDDDAQWWKGVERISPAPYNQQARHLKLRSIFAGELVIGEDGGPSWFQHPDNLLHGAAPRFAVIDVVQAQVGKDDVESCRRETASPAREPLVTCSDR